MTATTPRPSPVPTTKRILQESTYFFKGHFQPLLFIACLASWFSSWITTFSIGLIFIEGLFLSALLCVLKTHNNSSESLKINAFLEILIIYFPILGIIIVTPGSIGLVVVELFQFFGISSDNLLKILSSNSSAGLSLILLLASISALIAGIYATFRIAMAPAMLVLRREGFIKALQTSWNYAPFCLRQIVEAHLFITALKVISMVLTLYFGGNSTVTIGIVHVLMRLCSSFLFIFLFRLAAYIYNKENLLPQREGNSHQ